jgi:triacylglycerol lipase
MSATMTSVRARSFAFLFLVLSLFAPAARAQEPYGPPLQTPQATLAAALHCPATFKDAKHSPVLLVHGTFSDDRSNWSWNYVPALGSLGFDVCTATLPNNSLDDMQIQAEYVVYAVRQMAARSGELVSLIGASQGTLHPRWAVKWWPDVQDAVDDIIFLAAPHHGTEMQSSGTSFGRCFASCWQMKPGSDYLNALNAGDETPSDISYTSIYTIFDELVIPQLPESTSKLDGARNVALQDLCPGRPTEHVGISTADAVAYWLAVDALTHAGPADPARFDVATCAQAMMPGATPEALFTSGGSAGFNGEYIDHEPPLKAYARSSASPTATPEPSDAPAPERALSDDDGSETIVGAAEEVPVGDELPATGIYVLRYVAASLVLIALGLRITTSARVRRGAQSV